MSNHLHYHTNADKCHSNFNKIKFFLWIMGLFALMGAFTKTSALTLAEAESIALSNDPLMESHKAVARAWNNDAVADNQLPDPKLLLALSNVPLDSLSLSQEPVTQLIFGVQQSFPKGNSLELKQEQSEWHAKVEMARVMDRQASVKRIIREDFLNLYYQIEAVQIIHRSRKLFAQLVGITKAHYASGRVNQQDVLRADLELSRLDDRAIKIQTDEKILRSKLAQWLGEVAWKPVDLNYPVLPDLSDDDPDKLITKHPSITIETAKLEASKQGVAIAKQQYKPAWGLGLEFRKRFGENPDSSERADMIAAMVTLDIPLFTENRQDKRLVASEEKMMAVRLVRDNKLRKLKQIYNGNVAKLRGLDERHRKYKNNLIKSAEGNVKAAMKAYQSGVTEFTNLMRAHITELDIRLSDLRVRVDRSLSMAQLLYVTGE